MGQTCCGGTHGPLWMKLVCVEGGHWHWAEKIFGSMSMNGMMSQYMELYMKHYGTTTVPHKKGERVFQVARRLHVHLFSVFHFGRGPGTTLPPSRLGAKDAGGTTSPRAATLVAPLRNGLSNEEFIYQMGSVVADPALAGLVYWVASELTSTMASTDRCGAGVWEGLGSVLVWCWLSVLAERSSLVIDVKWHLLAPLTGTKLALLRFFKEAGPVARCPATKQD